MKNQKTAKLNRKNQTQTKLDSANLKFIEHLHELRRRLFYISASVILWSIAAYAVQQQIVNALIQPSNGQKFIYTSPIGGIDFLFRVCMYSGLALSIPVIVYNVLKYIEPLMSRGSTRFIAGGSFASGVLAVAGMAFGYFVGLPTALHFLLHQFTNHQITAMLTIQSYLSFVTLYMFGAALMFQLPLILIFINRIKPLTPSGMLRQERWVILLSFILAVLMNPTPNLIGQIVLAGPLIIAYQIAIVFVALTHRPKPVAEVIAPSPKPVEIIDRPKVRRPPQIVDIIVSAK